MAAEQDKGVIDDALVGMELASGLLAGALGAAGLAYAAVTDPRAVQDTSIVWLVVIVVAIVGSTIGMLLHRGNPDQPAGPLMLMWVAAVLLIAGGIATSQAIGGYIAPAMGAAVLAATVGSGANGAQPLRRP